MHGVVRGKMLEKTGKQVIKYWKHNGYAVSEADLEQVHGVKLHTQYDGILYAPRHLFYRHGIPNVYKGEKQLILPVEHWEQIEGRNHEN